jgi:ornithine cyclodeaminase
MLVLTNEDVAKLLPMKTAIECVAKAMVEVSAGRTELPLREIMGTGGQNGLGWMPGSMTDPGCFGVKLVCLFPGNPAAGYSSHQGAMVLFEPRHGSVVSMMNAGLLTAVRTAAASGVATRALARPDSSVLTVVGNGEQAEHHVDAMVAVRPIEELRIAGRDDKRVSAFAERTQSRFPKKGADIVCTTTAAARPVLFGEMVSPGTHLNVVGASVASKREIDTDLVVRARLFVDYRTSTFAQAGEVIEAIEQGAISRDHVCAEIGEVLSNESAGRRSESEITLYRSLGVAAQDLACAHHITLEARQKGLGVEASID